jgi:hypothetical protein
LLSKLLKKRNNLLINCVFDFLIEILEAKRELIKNYSEKELKKYEKAQKYFENRYWEYQKEFYLNIHKPDDD